MLSRRYIVSVQIYDASLTETDRFTDRPLFPLAILKWQHDSNRAGLRQTIDLSDRNASFEPGAHYLHGSEGGADRDSTQFAECCLLPGRMGDQRTCQRGYEQQQGDAP